MPHSTSSKALSRVTTPTAAVSNHPPCAIRLVVSRSPLRCFRYGLRVLDCLITSRIAAINRLESIKGGNNWILIFPDFYSKFPRLATASPQHRSAHCVSSATTPTPPLVTVEASHLAAPSPSVTADEPHPVTPISHAYQVPQCSIIGNDLVCSPNRPARALRKSHTTVYHRSNPKASSTIDDRTISTRIAAFERENFHLIRNLLQATGRTHVPFS